MMSLWDALRMNMMISYQELVRTFPKIAGKAMQGGLKVGGAVAVGVIAKLITTHLGG